MDSPHIIRLRGPWWLRALDSEGEVLLAERHKVAFTAGNGWTPDVSLPETATELHMVRNFNWPHALVPGTRMELVLRCDWIRQPELFLNGSRPDQKATSTGVRSQVEPMLRAQNELLLRFDLAESAGETPFNQPGFIRDIHLAIHEADTEV